MTDIVYLEFPKLVLIVDANTPRSTKPASIAINASGNSNISGTSAHAKSPKISIIILEITEAT